MLRGGVKRKERWETYFRKFANKGRRKKNLANIGNHARGAALLKAEGPE